MRDALGLRDPSTPRRSCRKMHQRHVNDIPDTYTEFRFHEALSANRMLSEQLPLSVRCALHVSSLSLSSQWRPHKQQMCLV